MRPIQNSTGSQRSACISVLPKTYPPGSRAYTFSSAT